MKEWLKKIQSTDSLDALEEIRVAILGKKGVLTKEFAELKNLDENQKIEKAKELNTLKEQINGALNDKKRALEIELEAKNLETEKIDVTLFTPYKKSGARHPINYTLDRIINYFVSMNFSVESGPLVEDDFHNFSALNLPKHHPARDMQDTFYFNDGKLLRTHTSPVQIRTMLKEKPPIRMIAPGAVFRRDYDLTHTPMFHQVELLYVDDKEKVSFANLKYILEDFLTFMFGDIKVRFRSSFFPFTEPSAEVDISCIFCGQKGCRVCKNTGWLEVLGCGLVDDNVFSAVGYKDVSGYAAGFGVERFAMLIHQVPDLRSMYENDLRLLEQFR